MSNFLKPLTPTKNRSNLKPVTPTKSKSLSNISSNGSSSCSSVNLSSSTKIMEDINLLLHLESLKRFRDNEVAVRQRIEEAHKLFEERRHKYFSLVAKYAALIKLASTRKVLLRNDLIDFPTETATLDAKSIKEKLSSGSATDYICTSELQKFKEMLLNIDKYKNLPIRRSELVDLQNATDAIQYSIEAIEISLEKCTTQGLDHFTNTLDMINYPKLLKEYEYNEY
ncbi:dim gamma-tubulin 4 [Cochliomyia hominivorax]